VPPDDKFWYCGSSSLPAARGFYAVDIVKPFQLKLTWDQLDDGL
jgi:hypothetical protein